MELKAGYKQTEVGVIPVDWEVRGVADFSRIITGPFGTLLKASEYTSGYGAPQVSVGEIGDGYFRVNEHTSRIPEHVVKRLPQYLLRVGDVVFGRKGAVERSALVTENESGWFLGSDGICVRPTDNCHPPYLAAQFRSRSVKAWLLNNAVGTTMPSLNQGVLGRVRVPFAPAAEQSAIATALSDVDALLAAQDAVIAKKRAIKQGAMDELLTGKRRLPGFSGEWEVKSLGNFGACHRGVTYDPANDLYQADSQESVRLLRANNVQDSTIDLDELQFVNNERVSEHQYLRRDDVLICMANGSKNLVGKAARFVLPDDVSYTFGAFMGCFRPDPIKISPEFAFYLFQTEAYRLHLANLLAGSSINNLSSKSIERLKIKIPVQVEEQSSIAEVLTDMGSELTALEARRAKTAQLKQGMMQALLTGRVRLV